MSQQTPQPGTEQYQPLPGQENALLSFARQPRILLLMLAGWALIAFLSELVMDSALFVEGKGDDLQLDGALASLAFNWEALALAVLYIYCARDPVRFHGVFWLALIALGASLASNLYHWLVTDTFSIESIFIPMIVSGGLMALVFMHLFADRADRREPAGAQARGQ